MLHCKPDWVHVFFEGVQLLGFSPSPPALGDLDIQDVKHDCDAEQSCQEQGYADSVITVLISRVAGMVA